MKVALIGDSQMQGLRASLVPALEALGIEVSAVEANQGWSLTRYIVAGTARQATAGTELAIVALGGNDQFGLEDRLAYMTSLERFRGQIAAPYVLWVGPAFATDPATSLKHGVTRRLQEKLVPFLHGTIWLDAYPYTQDGHRSDGVHFTPEAYAAWSQRILDAVAWLVTPPLTRMAYLGSFGIFQAFRSV